MPQLIPIALTAGGYATAAYVASTALVVYGAYKGYQQSKDAKKAFQSSLSDRKVMIRSADTPRSIVYGRQRISGPIIYARGAKSDADPYVWLVIALSAAHKINSIDEVYFGDTPLGALDAFGDVTGGAFARVVTHTWTQQGVVPSNNIISLFARPGVTEPIQLQRVVAAVTSSQAVDLTTGEDLNEVPVGILGNTQITFPSPGAAGRKYSVTYTYTFIKKHIRVYKRLGLNIGELPPAELVNTSGGEWTYNCIGVQVPLLYVRLDPDYDVFPNGLENISALVRGKDDIYDWRTAQRGYSVNAFMCAADYAVNEVGVTIEDINASLAVAHSNICDEVIPINAKQQRRWTSPGVSIVETVTTQTRYTADCALSTDVRPVENLSVLLGAMDGSAVFSGGQCDMRAGAYEEPEIVLTGADVVGEWSVEPRPPRPDVFNSVRGRFIDPDNSWVLHDYPPYISAFYAAQDGGREITAEIDLPATIDAERAQRLAKQVLHKARAGLTFSGQFNLGAVRLSPEQTVRLSIQQLGFDEKVFRIKQYRDLGGGRVSLSLKEDAEPLYDWAFDEATSPDPAPNTTLPNPRIVQGIFGLTVTSGIGDAAFDQNGQVIPQARISWLAVTDMLVLYGGRIEVQWKRAQENSWRTHIAEPRDIQHIIPVGRGEVLVVQARAVNSLGVTGAWSIIKHVVVDAPTPHITSSNFIKNARLIWEGTATNFPEWKRWRIPNGGSLVDGGSFGAYQNTTIHVQTGLLAIGAGAGGVGDIWYAESSPMSCKPGERLVSFVDTYGSGVLASFLQIVFYTNGDAGIAQDISTGMLVSPVVVFQTFGQPRVLSAFGVVPANAAYMRLRVGYQVRSTSSQFNITRPYIGVALQGQITLPPWIP